MSDFADAQRNGLFWQRYLELFCAKDFDSWAGLWHPEGEFILAYPSAGAPDRLQGREAIAGGLKALAGMVGNIRAGDTRLSQTIDPNRFWVEYRLQIEVPGQPLYENVIACRVRLLDGQIRELKEYADTQRQANFITMMAEQAGRTS